MTGRTTFISNMLNQTAVYWANPVNDGYGGRSFDTGTEVSVRWEQKQELFIDEKANELRSHAVVYTETDMTTGEYLYLGTLADLSSAEEGDPLSILGAYEIRATEKITNLAADRTLRKVWL